MSTQGQSGNLDGGRFLTDEYRKNPLRAALFTKVINAINTLSQNLSASPTGDSTPPPPVNSLSVKGTLAGATTVSPGEILHATANHTSAIQKGIQYVWQVSANDPSFSQPHYFDTGGGRTLITSLPALDDNGSTVNYYVRVIPQYHGSQPAAATVFGGGSTAAPINMTGTTRMTLLPSTGGGTASNSGTQANQGLGRFLFSTKSV